MSPSVQLNLPPLPVNRVATEAKADVNQVDTDELPLDRARELGGQIVTKTLDGTPLKAVADKGQVSRWKAGENPNFAKLISSEGRRKAMAKALLKSCKGVRLREVYEIEEVG